MRNTLPIPKLMAMDIKSRGFPIVLVAMTISLHAVMSVARNRLLSASNLLWDKFYSDYAGIIVITVSLWVMVKWEFVIPMLRIKNIKPLVLARGLNKNRDWAGQDVYSLMISTLSSNAFNLR